MPPTAEAAQRPAFARDRYTWTAYLLLGYYAYLQSLLGPLMPFLRAELGIGYVLGSLHLSAFAAGMVLTGLIGDGIARRIGFRAALWTGALGMAGGMAGLALAPHVALTLPVAGAMGVVGTLLLVAQQASLAHHHGPRRAVAFTEGNIVASLGAMLAPLAVGAAVSGVGGWRWALAPALLLLAALLLREGRRPVPEPPAQQAGGGAGRPLSRRFWACWAVACLGVAVEWSIGFWGADYMHTVAGLPIELAVTAMGVFFLAMLAGRVAGSRLTRHLALARLLSGALVLALAGVLVFWQAASSVVTIAGLALAGLGVGNLYPLSLAAAAERAPGQAAAVSARMTLAGGLAILTAPLVLGGWADRVGLAGAFALTPALLLAALAVSLGGQWAERSGGRAQSATR